MIIGLTGISAVGKTFLKRCAIEKVAGLYPICLVTERPKRPEEINGFDRYFVSKSEFDDLQVKNKLISIQDIYGIRYAFKREEVLSDANLISEMWYSGINELQTIAQIKSIYIYSNDSGRIIENLKLRYNDDSVLLNKRINDDAVLKIKLEKMAGNNAFNYVFENKFDYDSVLKFISLINRLIT